MRSPRSFTLVLLYSVWMLLLGCVGSSSEVPSNVEQFRLVSITPSPTGTVDVNASIVLTYNDNINNASTIRGNLTLTDSVTNTSVPIDLVISGATVTATPLHPLRPNASYNLAMTVPVTSAAGGNAAAFTQALTTENVIAGMVGGTSEAATHTISGFCSLGSSVTASSISGDTGAIASVNDNCTAQGTFDVNLNTLAEGTQNVNVTVTLGGVSTTVSTQVRTCLSIGAHPAATLPPGAGTVASPYLVDGPGELAYMATDTTGVYQLVADVDLSCLNWTPITKAVAYFSGTLDGNGYKIINFHSNDTADFVGLFGVVENATLRNLRMTNASISPGAATQFVGNLAGRTRNSTVQNVFVSGNFPAVARASGLVLGDANNTSTVTNVGSYGYVNSVNEYVGGAIGSIQVSDATNIYSLSRINLTTAGQFAGGVVGYFTNTAAALRTVSGIWAYANVTSTRPATGLLVGASLAAGTPSPQTLTGGYAWGVLNAVNISGGIVGGVRGSTISNHRSYGDIIGGLNCGGIVGLSYSTGTNATVIQDNIAYTRYNSTGNSIGGVIGQITRGSLLRNGFLGTINTTSLEVGGMVGFVNVSAVQTIAIEDNYVVSNTIASTSSNNNITSFVGVVDFNDNGGSVFNLRRNYASVQTLTGAASSQFGGIVREMTGVTATYTANFFEGPATPVNDVSGIGAVRYNFGANTQAATQTTLGTAGFDFSTVWTFSGGSLYPITQ